MPKRPKAARAIKVVLGDSDHKLLREAADALVAHSADGLPIARAKVLALRLWLIARRSEPAATEAAYRRSAAALAYQIRRELDPEKPAKTVRYEVSKLSGFSEKNIEVIVARERQAIKRFLAYLDQQAPQKMHRRQFLEECLRDNDKVFP